jgi:hypothetical protein
MDDISNDCSTEKIKLIFKSRTESLNLNSKPGIEGEGISCLYVTLVQKKILFIF